MNTVIHDEKFYRQEIETLTNVLSQAISEEQRKQFSQQLEAAKAHLEELETGKPVPFKR